MKGLIVGIKRHPLKAFVSAFVGFSVLWTIIEGFTYFLPMLDLRGSTSLLVVLVVSLLYSASRVWLPSMVEIPLKLTNTKIQIKFGDIFTEDGFRAIAMSEFFDSELGLPVSDKSIHGIFLKKCFGDHPESFDNMITSELKDVIPQNTNKKKGKNKRYPIGTTALVSANEDHYLCFALTKADTDTCKVSADVLMLWQALQGLWEKARNSSGGAPIVVPLVGSGISGIGLPSRELLDLIIISVIAETKQQQIAPCIRIVIFPDRFEELDLSKIKRHWN